MNSEEEPKRKKEKYRPEPNSKTHCAPSEYFIKRGSFPKLFPNKEFPKLKNHPFPHKRCKNDGQKT